ncbi:MAG: anthranilate synthase component I family protein [Gemmatimonadetes bacterium]|nr:anthranilate synthase component I family protein [Gemmatimonadota bacterium]
MLICRQLVDAPTPEQVFDRVSGLPWCVWFDSSDVRPDTGRWSFLAIDPYAVLLARDGHAWWVEPEGIRDTGSGGLRSLEFAIRRSGESAVEAVEPGADVERGCPIPFRGGAAGFLSYEIGSEIEILPGPRSRDPALPDLEFGFFDVVVGWDHLEGTCHVVSTGLPDRGDGRRNRASSRLDEVVKWIHGDVPPPHPRGALADLAVSRSRQESPDSTPEYPVAGTDGLRSNFTRAGYMAAVQTGIEKIRNGDIFQVNLSQRFTAPAPQDPVTFYHELRRRSPAPFGAFFRGSTCVIASASPERFVRLDREGGIQSRPIKGTRRRGADGEEDEELAAALISSDKDRAENLMIADLLRNDISRVSRTGTVRAAELFRLESFANVHHLVSIIEGSIRQGIGPVDVIRAMFPCGSVTGAPKIRAMEIIAELEPVARGPCYGSVGWIGIDLQMDFSVAIRTAVITAERAMFHAGGAVVSDSVPADEYAETLDKARALAATLCHEI